MKVNAETRARLPQWQPYDPRDAVADRVGEVNPIHWVRRTERRVREAKRLRRMACAGRSGR